MENETYKIECNECGHEIDSRHAYQYEGEYFCEDCFEHLFFFCGECGEVERNESIKTKTGVDICEGCFDEFHFSCEDCGNVYHHINTRTTNTGHSICPKCFSENYFVCNECGEIFHIDRACSTNDYYVCEGCFSENYFVCEDCGEIFHIDRAYSTNDYYVCEGCFSENYFVCNECGEIFHIDRACSTSNYYVCEGCFSENYFVCDDCGENEHNDNAIHTEENSYCSYCADENEINKLIHSYFYKPEWIPKRENRNERLYGIENEIECSNGNKSYLAEWIVNHYSSDFVFLKEDGTINNGFEIVSHPMTIKNHLEQPWKDLLSYLGNENCKSHNTTTCGLHIHAEKRGLKNLDVIKIVSFVNLNIENFQMLARRESSTFAHYKRIENGKALKQCEHSNGRYEVINLDNLRTIEFRMFRGTLKHSSLIGCIQLVDATIEFCKNGEIGIGYMFRNPDKTWNRFNEYILKNRKRYAILLTYMKEMEERKNRRDNERL